MQRKLEEQLREIIVEVRRDLPPLVLPLLGHPVRQRLQNLLAILQFPVGFLERLATEEHLPRQQ
ncbi:MAG TPA: hypothetical protein VF984_12155, partial [Actinomycetota bacterium]